MQPNTTTEENKIVEGNSEVNNTNLFLLLEKQEEKVKNSGAKDAPYDSKEQGEDVMGNDNNTIEENPFGDEGEMQFIFDEKDLPNKEEDESKMFEEDNNNNESVKTETKNTQSKKNSSPDKAKKDKILAILIFVVIGVVLVGIIGFFYISSLPQEIEPRTETTTEYTLPKTSKSTTVNDAVNNTNEVTMESRRKAMEEEQRKQEEEIAMRRKAMEEEQRKQEEEIAMRRKAMEEEQRKQEEEFAKKEKALLEEQQRIKEEKEKYTTYILMDGKLGINKYIVASGNAYLSSSLFEDKSVVLEKNGTSASFNNSTSTYLKVKNLDIYLEINQVLENYKPL